MLTERILESYRDDVGLDWPRKAAQHYTDVRRENMNNDGKNLAIWGTLLQSGMLISVGGIVLGTIRGFSSSQVQVIAQSMAIVLYAELIGFAISLVGIVLLLVALMRKQYRAMWFKTAMWTFCIIWPLGTPLLIGIVFSIIVMIYLSKHKAEFTNLTTSPN